MEDICIDIWRAHNSTGMWDAVPVLLILKIWDKNVIGRCGFLLVKLISGKLLCTVDEGVANTCI